MKKFSVYSVDLLMITEKGKTVKKNTLKYVIDVAMFVDLCSVTMIGLLLGFVIPKGVASDKYFLGLHRHEWGDIHLFLSLFFVALLVCHVWFNWKWVANTTQNFFGENWQKVLMAFSAGWIAVLLIGWIVVKLS
jgi:hypothetical protein